MARLPLRRVGLLLFTAFAFVLTGAGGCSRQGEGERCDFRNGGDADCDEGLVCVESDKLVIGDRADRCCPGVGESVSDSRCTRGMVVPPASGGSSGAGGSGGTAGAAGEGQGGLGGDANGAGGDATAGAGGEPPSGAGGESGMSTAGAGGA